MQGMAGRPVSWELLFHSLMLYHENLRRDLPSPEAASLYRHPPTRGITQREVDGLTSYLELLTTIITWVCCVLSTPGCLEHTFTVIIFI